MRDTRYRYRVILIGTEEIADYVGEDLSTIGHKFDTLALAQKDMIRVLYGSCNDKLNKKLNVWHSFTIIDEDFYGYVSQEIVYYMIATDDFTPTLPTITN